MPNGSLLDHGLWNASAEQFASQLRFLHSHSDLIPLTEMPAALESGSGRYTAITFDDGYRDNHEVALPILGDCNATATFFISTGLVDNPRTPWWDELAWIVRTTTRDRISVPGRSEPLTINGDRDGVIRRVQTAAKRLPGGALDDFVQQVAESAATGRIPDELRPAWLTWDQVREMRRAGMEIGGHTVNHPVLSRLSPERQQFELSESFRRIETELGERPRTMSYPVGGLEAYNDVTRKAAQDAGWELACHYAGGHLDGRIPDRYSVPRIAIEPYTRLNDLAAALAWPGHFS
jgi:peptidoglycan/xylan/chitin deacetylase (PgdA/CDA1 family)